MNRRVIVTGGTIDKRYDPLTGELGFDETHVEQMLERAGVTGRVTVEELLMLDSLDMTEEERRLVIQACAAAPESSIVITHGTDTMVETAQAIKRSRLKRLASKTIVLTGAMIPYSFGESSDAFFNFGTALAHAQVLPPDVYISMNGHYFPSSDVRKNRILGVFQPLGPTE